MRRILTGVAALSVVATANAADVSFTGFIKASAVTANQAVGSVESNGAESLGAVTEALNNAAVTAGNPDYYAPRTSMQTQQSRFATIVKQGNAKGTFEMDFMGGSTNSSPTQGASPRLRLANIEYKLNDSFTVFGGQKWSTFSGVQGSHSFNFVGNNWKSGNVGFLQQELGFDWKLSDFTITAALQNAGQNTGTTGIVETSSPLYALKVNWDLSDTQKVGVAFQGGRLHNTVLNNALATDPNRKEFGALAYYDATYGDLNVKAEAFAGQNLNNAGNLTLQSGTATENIQERGGFISAQYALCEKSKVSAAWGVTQVSNNKILGANKLSKNASTRVNYSYTLGDGVSVFAEYTKLTSNYTTTAATGNTVKRTADVFELGLLYRF